MYRHRKLQLNGARYNGGLLTAYGNMPVSAYTNSTIVDPLGHPFLHKEVVKNASHRPRCRVSLPCIQNIVIFYTKYCDIFVETSKFWNSINWTYVFVGTLSLGLYLLFSICIHFWIILSGNKIISNYLISCWWFFLEPSGLLSSGFRDIQWRMWRNGWHDLERPLNKGQGHSFWYQSIPHNNTTSYRLSIVNFALRRTV